MLGSTANESRSTSTVLGRRPGSVGCFPCSPAVPVGEATEAINASSLVVVMLETPQALENVEAIAAVEGVDGLLVGTNDLCMEMRIPGRVGDPAVMEAQAKVIDACRRHGRSPGLGGVFEPALMGHYIEMGMRLVLCGNDLSVLTGALTPG